MEDVALGYLCNNSRGNDVSFFLLKFPKESALFLVSVALNHKREIKVILARFSHSNDRPFSWILWRFRKKKIKENKFRAKFCGQKLQTKNHHYQRKRTGAKQKCFCFSIDSWQGSDLRLALFWVLVQTSSGIRDHWIKYKVLYRLSFGP
jgi:hypothetical protein